MFNKFRTINFDSKYDYYDYYGFNKIDGLHKNGSKYDDEGFDRYGYNVKGINKDKYDIYGVKHDENKCNFHTCAFDKDKLLYDYYGFNKIDGLHKNGSKYDDEGFDRYGYNTKGVNKDKYDIYGKKYD